MRNFPSLFDRPAAIARAVAIPAAPLLLRLAFGQMFVVTGLGKLQNLPKIVEFFDSLGIPFASVQAPMISALEFVGGIALLLGLCTRSFAFLLACTMVVAILTADGPALLAALPFRDSLAGVAPVPPLVAFLALVAHGAGPLSLDRLIAHWRRSEDTAPAVYGNAAA